MQSLGANIAQCFTIAEVNIGKERKCFVQSASSPPLYPLERL